MAVNNLNIPGVGIQPSLIDAKGDLLVGTANDAIDRLGVTGTTGAVLTADAGETTGLKWAAAGSVGGLVYIETQTFTSVSGFSFSNDVFTNAYENYRLLIEMTTTAATAGLRWRGRIAGSDTSLTNYNFQNLFASSTTVGGARFTGQSSGFLGDIYSANPGNASAVDIFAPKVAKRTRVLAHTLNSDFDISLAIPVSAYNLTTSFDSLTIFGSTGNITGKAFLYGYRD